MEPGDHFQKHKAEALMWLDRIEHGLKQNRGLPYVMAEVDCLRECLEEWELTEDAPENDCARLIGVNRTWHWHGSGGLVDGAEAGKGSATFSTS